MSGSTISTSITAAGHPRKFGLPALHHNHEHGRDQRYHRPNATDGAQGSRAIYAATSLPSGTVQNDGRLIGGIGYITGGTGVYLYGHDRLSNSGVILGGYSTNSLGGGGGSGVYLAAQEGASLTNAGTIAGGNGNSTGGDAIDVGTAGNFFFYSDRFSVDSTLAGVVFNNGLLVGGTGETDTVDSDGSGSFTFGGNGGLGVFSWRWHVGQ